MVDKVFTVAHRPHETDYKIIITACKLRLFLHLSVSHSVHRGVSASVHAGIHNTPPADTPQSRPHLDRPPEADNLPEQTPPGSRHPQGAVHAGRYGQQAGGTHPTGMHTCFQYMFRFKQYNNADITNSVFRNNSNDCR